MSVRVEIDLRKPNDYRVHYEGTYRSVHCGSLEQVNEAVAYHFMKCSRNEKCPACCENDRRSRKR